MRVLVTGGAGYIGSHFLHYLKSEGFSSEEILVFDNLERGFRENIPQGVKIIQGDLKNKEEIRTVFIENEIDFVVHFAAYAYVGESMNEPEKYFYNNIIGGLNLLEAMRERGCNKIIFSSSCATYGIPEEIPIKERTIQKPINPYGETKLIFEKILEWYSKIYNLKFVALRYFNASGADFGIGEKHEPETHLIPLVIKAIITENPVKIFGTDYPTEDGTCIRDYIHVTDLANAHFLAMKYLENKTNSSLKVNLGTGVGSSVKEIISISERILGKKAKLDLVERRAGDPAVLVADATFAKKSLQWEPKSTIKEIIKSAIDWEIKLRENVKDK
jgi:UDP-glucose 4-epimerase